MWVKVSPLERANEPTLQRPPADPIPLLRRAIARRCILEVAYDTGGRGQLDTRLLRPPALEAHGPVWYLRAYCPRPPAGAAGAPPRPAPGTPRIWLVEG